MKQQQGFSIVELMVAMTLGLVLMAGVMQILTSSQSSYSELVQQARMQEAGKIALDAIVRDLRMVGYWGCNSQYIPVANTIEKDHAAFFDMADSLEGWTVGGTDYDAGDFGTLVPLAGSDIIEMHIANIDSGLTVAGHNPTAATIELTGTIRTPKGTVWTVIDSQCNNIGIFAQSNEADKNTNNNVHKIVHGTGSGAGGTHASNCTKVIKGHFDCDDELPTEGEAYSDGSSVFQMQDIAFLVAPSNQNPDIPSLYRKTLNVSGDSEPIIDGVSNLSFSFGLDTNSDGVVDIFANADTIRSNISYSFLQAISIAIEVQVQSLDDVGLTPQTFTTSVRLRNRGLS